MSSEIVSLFKNPHLSLGGGKSSILTSPQSSHPPLICKGLIEGSQGAHSFNKLL